PSQPYHLPHTLHIKAFITKPHSQFSPSFYLTRQRFAKCSTKAPRPPFKPCYLGLTYRCVRASRNFWCLKRDTRPRLTEKSDEQTPFFRGKPKARLPTGSRRESSRVNIRSAD
ncbi:hypothetical protein THAOC_16620, partial [Thalassiosira oceanica]